MTAAPQVLDLAEKFSAFDDHWLPHVVGQVNGQELRVAKFQGRFEWHSHADTDELFLVVHGEFQMHFRDRSETVRAGQLIVVPRGVEHCPEAAREVHVLMLEAPGTLNTGENPESERTHRELPEL